MLSSAVTTARGASYLLIQVIVTNLAMVVSFAILARLVTTKDMGVLAVLMLIVNFSQIIVGPISQAVTKFVSENLNAESKGVPVLFQSLKVSFALMGPLAAVVFVGASFLSRNLLGEQSYAIFFQLLAVDIIFFVGLTPLLNATLLGFRKYKEMAGLSLASTVLRQTLIILLIIMLESFIGLVVAWVISDFVTSFIYLAYILKICGRPRYGFSQRQLLHYSWPLWISNALGFTQNWFDRSIMLFYLPLAVLGVYNATLTAFAILIMISGTVTSSLFPVYSSHGWERYVHLSESVRLATRYASIVILPLSLGLLATAKPALELFLGNAYLDGTQPLIILSAAFSLTVISTAIGPILLASGETQAASIISTVAIICSVTAAFILLPIAGIVGATVARAIGMILSSALTIIVVKRKNYLGIDAEGLWKSAVAATVMASVIILVQFFEYSRFLVPLYIIIGVGVYVGMLRLLKTFHEEDIELFRLYLGPRLTFVSKFIRIVFQEGPRTIKQS